MDNVFRDIWSQSDGNICFCWVVCQLDFERRLHHIGRQMDESQGLSLCRGIVALVWTNVRFVGICTDVHLRLLGSSLSVVSQKDLYKNIKRYIITPLLEIQEGEFFCVC